MKNKMLTKIMVATLLGSLALFIWGAFSHLVLFIGAGFKPLPNEETVLAALKTNVGEKGLYFFPGKDFRTATKEQDVVFEEKFRTGPVGLVVYRPMGGNPFSGSKVIIQFFSNLFSVFIAVIIALFICTGYWNRVALVSMIGLSACLSVSTIYWNWYEFPGSFFVAQLLDVTIGFFLVALVICRVLKNITVQYSNNN